MWCRDLFDELMMLVLVTPVVTITPDDNHWPGNQDFWWPLSLSGDHFHFQYERKYQISNGAFSSVFCIKRRGSKNKTLYAAKVMMMILKGDDLDHDVDDGDVDGDVYSDVYGEDDGDNHEGHHDKTLLCSTCEQILSEPKRKSTSLQSAWRAPRFVLVWLIVS